MTTIIVTQDDGEIDEFDFDREKQRINIGRRPSNEVCIPDRSVSAAHAQLTIDSNEAWIEDLNSTNGTYVNGQPITRHRLADGDDIVLGKIRLGFVGAGIEARRQQPGEEAVAGETATHDAAWQAEARSATAGVASASATSSAAAATALAGANGVAERARQVMGRENTDRPHLQSVASSSPARSTDASSHPLDGLDGELPTPPTHELGRDKASSEGAVIQIKNGAKVGQVLPIDKPVTTLGRPGIQIAAIMRKPDGYFLMHIESDDNVELPTLNSDSIGDEPVLLHSGDELNVAGIDVEFMLS